jgi:antibiotic biosynthesis monooxygenase (ABM) superfamily enzyme
MAEEPLTIVITRRVRLGHEAPFEQALADWIPQSVTCPGHQGALIVRPSGGGREYGAVLRFRTRHLWQAFQESAEYQTFLENIRPHLDDDPRVAIDMGLEAWFRGAGTSNPPVWKMAIVTWVGVCLTVGLLGVLLGPMMSSWTWLTKLLVMNAAVVAMLTWIVMPILVRGSRIWLRLPTKN